MLNRSSLVYQGVGNGEYGLGISLEYAGYLWANNGAPVKVDGNVGFYGTAPAAKPTVSGSRGGNAALDSLLTALAGLGLITNSTTA